MMVFQVKKRKTSEENEEFKDELLTALNKWKRSANKLN
jgi:hypothetical protein